MYKGENRGTENNMPQTTHLVQEEGRLVRAELRCGQKQGRGKGPGQCATSPNLALWGRPLPTVAMS